MKLAENKQANSATRQRDNFFSKENSGGFFGNSAGQNSFFTGGGNNSHPIQAKLEIGRSGDAQEQEADMMADKVVQRSAMSEETIQAKPANGGIVQAKCAECEKEDKLQKKEEESSDELPTKLNMKSEGPPAEDHCPSCGTAKNIQTKASDSGQSMAPDHIEAGLNASKGSGSPLPRDTKDQMENSFGADFSNVRLHTDSSAVQMNKDLNAQAFTHGNNIYFNAGKYDTNSSKGTHLLAHELTHVVQQGAAGSKATTQRKIQRVPDWLKSASDWVVDTAVDTAGSVKDGAKWVGGKVAQGASAVASAVEEGVGVIADEIKGLVSSGMDWLKEKWLSIKNFASSGFESAQESFDRIVNFVKAPINIIANAIMSFNEDSLSKGWAKFYGMITEVADGFKMLTSNLLQKANNIWEEISGYAGSLLNKVAGLTQSFLFRKLPDTIQRLVMGVIDQLKSLWKSINDGWTKIITRIKKWIEDALAKVLEFVNRVATFGIHVLLAGIRQFGKLVLFLKDLFTNPNKYLNILAQKAVASLNGVEGKFSGVVSQYFNGDKKTQPPAGVIQKQEQPGAAPVVKGTATWSQVGHGVWEMMGKKWQEFKSNPLAVVKTLLLDLFFPIYGNVMDVIEMFKHIWKIVTGPLSASSLHDVWTSLLKLLDIPLIILHTVISILMRSLMVPLIVASFIPHPVVKAVAALVGYILLGAFVQAELLNIGHKLVLLKSGNTTEDEKKEAYNRIADSLIAMAMTAVIMIIMLILHFMANVVKGIYNFIKGKVFPVEAKPVEVKGSGPEGKGGEGKGEGKGEEGKSAAGEGKGSKEIPSEDGKRKVRINEEGKCEVCASPCDKIRERYKAVMTPELEAKIKAIEGDGKLTDPQKAEKLKPVEQELSNLNNKTGRDITSEILDGRVKPDGGKWRWANNWKKWVEVKGGRVIEYADGSFDLVEKGGTKVRYSPDGYPDFKPYLDHPSGVKQVEIDKFDPKRTPDYKKANQEAGHPEWGDEPPDKYSWHHHQNGTTMQLVPEWMHTLFRHAGGIANL